MSVVATEQRALRCVSRLTLPSVAFVAFAMITGFAIAATPARAAVADDATGAGPYTPKSADYKLPAVVDPLVTKGSKDERGAVVKTELWARVWYPTNGPALSNAPIVVFLHGEHGTCGRKDGKWRIDDQLEYSFTGVCPAGYEVTPNHWGYDYVASRLATQGYVTISINTNRGINQIKQDTTVDPDPDLIIRRGRMILRHLMQFGQWDRGIGSPDGTWFSAIKGKMDWTKVSLVGHSRGGDAIVNAYYQFRGDTDGWKARLPSNMQIVAIAAIAPTDVAVQKGVPGDPLPLKGVGYGVLLPMCDADVFRLEGVKHYDRAVGYFPDLKGNFKAVFAVNGANHNGFNSEWHTQDRFDFGTGKPTTQNCPGQGKELFAEIGTSADQQEIGRHFVMSIVRGKTKGGSWAETLNPAFELPKPIAKFTIERSWFPGTPLNGAVLLKRFSRTNVTVDCDGGVIFPYRGVSASCLSMPEHRFDLANISDKRNVWAARVRWGKPANKDKPENKGYWAFLNLRTADSNFEPINLGRSSKLKTLDIRLAPDCDNPDNACISPSKQAPKEDGSQNIAIQFVDDKQHYSNRHLVDVKNYVAERQAVGLDVGSAKLYHSILSSVRIPLTEFEKDADGAFNMSKVVAILILFSSDGLKKDNKAGGLYIGDIWATTEATTSMKFETRPDALAVAEAEAASPPPAMPGAGETGTTGEPLSTGVEPTLAPDLVTAPADTGARVADAERKTLPAAAMPGLLGLQPGGDVDVVELTLASRSVLVGGSGFSVSLGGRSVSAAATGGGARQIRLAVPAAQVDAAADGAAVVVTSGGSTWSFGPLNKGSIR